MEGVALMEETAHKEEEEVDIHKKHHKEEEDTHREADVHKDADMDKSRDAQYFEMMSGASNSNEASKKWDNKYQLLSQ